VSHQLSNCLKNPCIQLSHCLNTALDEPKNKELTIPHQTCGACKHPELEAIDAALKSKLPLRAVALRFGLSVSTVFAHAHEGDAKKSHKNTGEIARIDKEIIKLHGVQNRAKRKKNVRETLAVARELRSWHGLRLKAVAIDAARPTEQLQPLSQADAMAMARTIIESALGDPDTVLWLRSVLERIPGTPRE